MPNPAATSTSASTTRIVTPRPAPRPSADESRACAITSSTRRGSSGTDGLASRKRSAASDRRPTSRADKESSSSFQISVWRFEVSASTPTVSPPPLHGPVAVIRSAASPRRASNWLVRRIVPGRPADEEVGSLRSIAPSRARARARRDATESSAAPTTATRRCSWSSSRTAQPVRSPPPNRRTPGQRERSHAAGPEGADDPVQLEETQVGGVARLGLLQRQAFTTAVERLGGQQIPVDRIVRPRPVRPLAGFDLPQRAVPRDLVGPRSE